MEQTEAESALKLLAERALELVGEKPFSQAHARLQLNMKSTLKEIFGPQSIYDGHLQQLTYEFRGTMPFGEYNINREEINGQWYDADLQRAAGILEAALDDLKMKGIGRVSQEKKGICFLSFKFTPQAKEYAAKVKHYLELQGLEVLTGERFQPTSLKEKIEPMLDEAEFGVAILGSDGQSAWTRDEVRALADKGKHVIFLVEEGVNFEQALFGGDMQYIPFPPGHISEGFIELLEGIQFVQNP